ncbi:MAG: InlB B-repeat-containing protein [Chitinispirillales bacterium]|nr:InlB B-repeat-containing protein [Chitinispirillales bacterium]
MSFISDKSGSGYYQLVEVTTPAAAAWDAAKLKAEGTKIASVAANVSKNVELTLVADKAYVLYVVLEEVDGSNNFSVVRGFDIPVLPVPPAAPTGTAIRVSTTKATLTVSSPVSGNVYYMVANQTTSPTDMATLPTGATTTGWTKISSVEVGTPKVVADITVVAAETATIYLVAEAVDGSQNFSTVPGTAAVIATVQPPTIIGTPTITRTAAASAKLSFVCDVSGKKIYYVKWLLGEAPVSMSNTSIVSLSSTIGGNETISTPASTDVTISGLTSGEQYKIFMTVEGETDVLSAVSSVTVGANPAGVGTVASVTVSPATASVSKGGTREFTATVNVGAGTPATTVNWSITTDGKAAGTTISGAGLLTVAPDETKTSLEIRAASTADNTKSATAVVTVTAPVTYTVTWNLDGGQHPASGGAWDGVTVANGVYTQAKLGGTAVPAALSPNPAKDSYLFGGWYTDAARTKAAAFPYTVASATTFYAKWNVTVGGAAAGKIYQYVKGAIDENQPGAIGSIVATLNQSAVYVPKTISGIGDVASIIYDTKYGAGANYKVTSVTYAGGAVPYVYTLSGTNYVPAVATAVELERYGIAASAMTKHGVVDAGTYTVTATVEYVKGDTVRIGNSEPVTFTVKPRDLSKATMSITLTDKGVYDGREKAPYISISDGANNVLVAGTDYELAAHTAEEWTNAGTITVVARGKEGGRYSGETEKRGTFTTAPAPLKFAETQAYASDPFKKAYDGTTDVDTATKKLDIKFVYTSGGETVTGLTLGDNEGYFVTNLKYNTATVGTDKTVTATVRLGTVGKAKNYSLATGTFSVGGQVIEKNVPTASMFTATYGSPAKALTADGTNRVLFTNSAKIVDVKWVTAVSSNAGRITVRYNGETVAPKEIGSYAITVDVTAGTNLDSLSGIALGTLNIESALPPEIDPLTPADTSYYASSSVTLRVTAANPKDGKTNGLTYQWYEVGIPGVREDTLVLQRGAASATFNVKDTVVGQHQYRVKVTYKDSEQDTASAWSRDAVVTVYPAPKSIKGALVVAAPVQEYVYSGTKITPTAEDFSVSVDGQALEPNRDYRVKSADNSTNAGENTALVTFEGVNAYKDTEIGTFTIAKRPVSLEDLVITYSVDYSAETQEIKVAAKSGLNGLGAVTRVYTPDTASRNNAGTWDVVLSIAEGQNFEAVEALPLAQQYTIRKAVFSASMLNYANLPKEVAWTGENQGIAPPTLKGLGVNYTGTLTVVYERGSEELSSAVDSGTYAVKARIGGDRNFSPYELNLGRVVIHGQNWVSVAQGNREVPVTGGTAEAAVAPVTSPVSGVAVGPSPVRSGDKVSIYWNGAKSVKGKLAVFSGLGEKVATVSVSGTKKVGEWNVVGVAEGTYVVKGVLTDKDGVRVKVSTLVSVVR